MKRVIFACCCLSACGATHLSLLAPRPTAGALISDNGIWNSIHSEQEQLIEQAEAAAGQGKFDEARSLIAKVLETLDDCREEYSEVWFRAKRVQARIELDSSDCIKACLYARTAIEFAREQSVRLPLNEAYRILAVAHAYLGMEEQCLRYHRREFRFACGSKDPRAAINVAYPFVQQLLDFGQIETAIDWIERTLKSIECLDDPGLRMQFQGIREYARLLDGDADAAAKNLEQLIEQAGGTLDGRELSQLYLYLSQAELKRGNFEAALAANEQDIRLGKGNRTYELDSQLIRANILRTADRAVEALELLVAIKPKTVDLPHYESRRLFGLSQIFFQLERYKLAFHALARYQMLLKQQERTRSAGQLALLDDHIDQHEQELQVARREQDAADAQVKIERAATEAQAAITRQRQSERNLLIIALVGLGGMGFMAYRYLLNRKLRCQQQQLNEELSRQLKKRTLELAEQTQAQLKLEQEMERRRRDHAVGQLTGGVAHDFNNLLAIIQQSNELAIIHDPDMEETAAEQLRASSQAAFTGARIIKQLLAFARKSSIVPRPMRISQWLDSASELFGRAVGSHQFEIVCEFDQPDPIVEVDHSQLTTAIINLLCNSRDAMPRRGLITLLVSCCDQLGAGDSVSGKIPAGRYVLLEIRDQGPGMTREQIELVCQPYYSTKTHVAGTGLGLSSVRGFVEQSSGYLQIESEVGRGTSVSIYLPAIESDDSHAFEADVREEKELATAGER